MRNFIKTTTIALVLSIASTDLTEAQERSKDSTGVGLNIGIHPLFLLSNTLKLDFEIQTKDRKIAHAVSTEIYGAHLPNDATREGNFSARFMGFGIGLHQKHKFASALSSWYAGYGIMYRHQQLQYSVEDYYPYSEKGLNYYGYGLLDRRKKINSILVSSVLGYLSTQGYLSYDAYIGIGYKAPFKKIDFGRDRDYNAFPSYITF